MYELPRVSFPGSRDPFHVMKCLAPAIQGPMKINNAVLSYVTFHQAVVFHPIISFEITGASKSAPIGSLISLTRERERILS